MYLLIPAVLLTWGMIIYKIVSYTKSEVDTVGQKKNTPAKTGYVAKDTFELYLNYNDPFLGHNADFFNPPKKKEEEKKPEKKEKKAQGPFHMIRWPKIEYLGIAQNKKDSNKVIVLTINKKEYLVKEHDEIEDITLEKIYHDSIVLQLNDQNKTFIRK